MRKAILLNYCKEHHFPNPVFFVNDGYSDFFYNRPGVKNELIKEETA
jgi:hypothetical protein